MKIAVLKLGDGDERLPGCGVNLAIVWDCRESIIEYYVELGSNGLGDGIQNQGNQTGVETGEAKA